MGGGMTMSDSAQSADPRLMRLEPEQSRAYVTRMLEKRDGFLETCRKHGSPLYVIDEALLVARAREFRAAFTDCLDDVKFYYAVKSNNHPDISRILLGRGYGLDVSSGEELEQAIRLEAQDIVFSGPGKTESELTLAIKHNDRLKILVDSFGELQRLEQLAKKLGCRVRIGVRLCTQERGLWRKFGIFLAELPRFIEQAGSCPHIDFCGLQFHTSWNLNAVAQVAFLRRLADTLGELEEGRRSLISFIDIGGGYWPPDGEWLQSEAALMARTEAKASFGNLPQEHYYRPSTPIDGFARQLADAVGEYIYPLVKCAICLEPGRWVCHEAMHILLTVVDKKAEDLVITDGGTNAIGWERFESDYFPVINLSRPGVTEHGCLIAGSLCTPHDVWGFGYFGNGLEPGDVLLIPTQGAYTYSLRQHFIKPLPGVALMRRPEDNPDRQSHRNKRGKGGLSA